MAKQNAAEDHRVVTGLVRLGYVALTEPRADEGGKEKYKALIMIPKTDKATVRAIKKAIAVATENGKDSKFGGKIPRNLKTPLRDGDNDDFGEDKPELENHYFLNASNIRQPGLVDKKVKPIVDPDEIYSGMYAFVDLSFYAYNSDKAKGIACGLENVQKVKDGERLSGGGRAATEAFSKISDDEYDEYDDDEEDEDDPLA